jgi:hypothetical protein
MFGGVLSRMFAIKSLMYLYPFQMVIFFSLTITVVLGYLMMIFENGIEIKGDGTSELLYTFPTLNDAFWFLWITYTTGIFVFITF